MNRSLIFQRGVAMAALLIGPLVVLGVALQVFVDRAGAAEPAGPEGAQLERQFSRTVAPFLKTYCHDCHGSVEPEAKLDLTAYPSLDSVARGYKTWEIVLGRLEAGEMPPPEAAQPKPDERKAIVAWIRGVRSFEARRHAGDPGVVPTRRLNSAEYNYSIRDLTGVDIRPTREFPVDPANEAGFDNSGESLAMSPALMQKYVDAARHVAEHLVLKPHGIEFAPHPVATNTDRDKYCVKRIVEFYERQPTDLAAYFLAAWRLKHRGALGKPGITLAGQAAADGVSAKYLARVWSVLSEMPKGKDGEPAEVGPMARLHALWQGLPAPHGNEPDAARAGCEAMRDWVVQLRHKLEPTLKDIDVAGIHKGSQTFVLWKNRQYVAYRRSYDRDKLQVEGETATESRPRNGGGRNREDKGDDKKVAAPDPDLTVPADPDERARYEASFARFCDVFPDAFFISERGRDYLGKSKDEQEKGRLLSAGFHSMMGYFRDDAPLYDLVLDQRQQAELDGLWQELDFVTSAPMRQYTGFLWFERTDSKYMRDPEFDFARAEDKKSLSEANIKKLAEVYLDKARRNGAEGTPVKAIQDYFKNINSQIRWVERARLAAEPSHLEALADFAERACRRPLTKAERDGLLDFYHALRAEDLTHEEAVQDVLVSVLVSPHFCYRMDLVAAGEGVRPLTDYELASRLSYFLWSSLPDRELLDRAAAGDLHRPEVLAAQARRMLQDWRVRGLAVEFAGNWLDFRRFEEHNSVDRERFPEFTNDLRQAMFEEPIRFFLDLVQRDGSLLDLLYGQHTFVNPVLAAHYGMPVPEVGLDEWVRIDDAAKYGRGGLLPMAVFLTQNSPGLRTSPVKRGYWVVRRLLGERIPPPPPNVPEIPNDETKLGDLTLRQVLARHRENKSCAACHQRFDSIGLAFENFGPVGERRTVDLGGRRVDTRAAFPGGEEGAGLAGLRDYLREQRQEEFLDNLCRKLLSYGLGRTLILSDDLVVEKMRRDLAANGYRFGDLVADIVTSPQFLNKRGSPAE